MNNLPMMIGTRYSLSFHYMLGSGQTLHIRALVSNGLCKKSELVIRRTLIG